MQSTGTQCSSRPLVYLYILAFMVQIIFMWIYLFFFFSDWTQNNICLVLELISNYKIFTSRTEDEIGVDNLQEVNVPEDLIDKFEEMDKNYLSWLQTINFINCCPNTFNLIDLCKYFLCNLFKFVLFFKKKCKTELFK